MILRAALQMLQQRLAERVDKGGDRQLLLILRQTAPLLQGPGWHQIFPQPDDDVGPYRSLGALVHQGLQPLAVGATCTSPYSARGRQARLPGIKNELPLR